MQWLFPSRWSFHIHIVTLFACLSLSACGPDDGDLQDRRSYATSFEADPNRYEASKVPVAKGLVASSSLTATEAAAGAGTSWRYDFDGTDLDSNFLVF